MSAVTKECPICCEAIHARAKKCPHCHQWQSRVHTIVLHPAFGILCGMLPLFLIYGAGAWLFYRAANVESRDFTPYIGQMTVLESRISFFGNAEEPRVMTVGSLRNDSPHAWSNLEFDVKYFDSDGNLIDAASERTYKTVSAGGELAFAVTSQAHQPAEAYASQSVSVRWAEEPENWPF